MGPQIVTAQKGRIAAHGRADAVHASRTYRGDDAVLPGHKGLKGAERSVHVRVKRLSFVAKSDDMAPIEPASPSELRGRETVDDVGPTAAIHEDQVTRAGLPMDGVETVTSEVILVAGRQNDSTLE